MKKGILLLTLSILIIRLFGQIPTDSVSNLFVYDGVVKVDSLSSEIIFNSAKEWLVRNLKSSDNNINLNDQNSKSLTVTGNIHLEDRGGLCAYKDINLNFKFSIFIKEGKYKYVVENFFYSYLKMCGNYGGNSPVSGPFEKLDFGKAIKEKVYKEANIKILFFIADLEKNIKLSADKKKNDW